MRDPQREQVVTLVACFDLVEVWFGFLDLNPRKKVIFGWEYLVDRVSKCNREAFLERESQIHPNQ